MEGINQKSESEVLDEEFIQASTDFERVSTRIIEIMTSPQFFSEVDDPNSEYEKLKSERDILLEKIENLRNK